MSVLSDLVAKAREVVGTLEVEGSEALPAVREFVATLEAEAAKEVDKVVDPADEAEKAGPEAPADTTNAPVDTTTPKV